MTLTGMSGGMGGNVRAAMQATRNSNQRITRIILATFELANARMETCRLCTGFEQVLYLAKEQPPGSRLK